jgi:hypothetical protein
MPSAGPIRVGLCWGKFGDPKALGLDLIFLGPASRPNSLGSDVGTQFS